MRILSWAIVAYKQNSETFKYTLLKGLDMVPHINKEIMQMYIIVTTKQ